MNAESFKELARSLASMDEAGRKRLLRQELEALPQDELPAWLPGACSRSEDLSRAALFAKEASQAILSAPAGVRPPARVREARYESEEREATVLLAMLGWSGAPNSPEQHAPSSPSEAATLSLDAAETAALGEGDLGLFPALTRAWALVRRNLEIEEEALFLIAPGAPESGAETGKGIASILPSPRGSHPRLRIRLAGVGLSLSEEPLAFVLGRALGSHYFRHGVLHSFSLGGRSLPASGSGLPAEAAAGWLRWRRLADISADRVGLLACGDLASAARALLHAELDLAAGCLPLDDRDLIDLAGRLRRPPEFWERSDSMDAGIHPLGLRTLAMRSYLEASDMPPEVRDKVTEALLRKHPRHPACERGLALMEALAAAGTAMLAADGRIDAREGCLLVTTLHRFFTDRPDEVLSSVLEDPKSRLAGAMDALDRHGAHRDGEWLIEKLIEIAVVDGSLRGLEIPVLLSIAERLGLDLGEATRKLASASGVAAVASGGAAKPNVS